MLGSAKLGQSMAQFEVVVFAVWGFLAAQSVAEQFVLVAALLAALSATLLAALFAALYAALSAALYEGLTVAFSFHPLRPLCLCLCLLLLLL